MIRLKTLLSRALVPLLIVASTVVVMFVSNGFFLAAREKPYLSVTRQPARRFDYGPRTVKVMAWNLSNAGIFEGDGVFAPADRVNARLQQTAEVIRKEQPDFLFLPDVIRTAGLRHVNQPAFLAEKCEMHVWSFGENYSVGIVGFRVIGGNAILSRYPMEPLGNPDLPGGRPVLRPRSHRRVLWCQTRLAGREIRLACIHNDAANPENNRRQTEQILAYAGDRPALLAGTFNAHPDDPSIELILGSHLFSGDVTTGLKLPAGAPNRGPDYFFAPADWELVEFRVLEDSGGEHRPIVAIYRLP